MAFDNKEGQLVTAHCGCFMEDIIKKYISFFPFLENE